MTTHSTEPDLAARVRAALTNLDDIAGRRALLESWIELDPSLEPLDLAAALVGLLEEAEASPAATPEREARGDAEPGRRAPYGDGPPRRTKEGALPRKPDEGNEIYRIGVGYRDAVKPSQIVAIISREGMLDGRLIGNIDIHDEHTYVELPEGMPEETFEKLRTVDIQGRPMAIERYEGETSQERRRPRRDDRGFQRGGPRRGGGGKGFHGGGGRGGRRDFHGGGRSYRGDGDSRGGGRSHRGDGDARGGDRSYRGGDSRGGGRSYRGGGDSRGGGRRYQAGGRGPYHGGGGSRGGYRGQDRSR